MQVNCYRVPPPLYAVEDGDLAAVDPAVIKTARQSRAREGMTILYMYEKIQGELAELMALHVHAGGTPTCRASVVD